MSLSDVDLLKNKLCKYHSRSYCCMVGNGTTAIALTLKALGVSGGNVAVPNSVCTSVPMGVYFSGNKPVYLDVNLNTLGLSVSALESCPETLSAVIVVHAYGSITPICDIASFCSNLGIPLIEDAAVSMGAFYDGRPVGSMGDVSILSFGSSKIIDAGHGGAILTNDSRFIHELLLIESNLPDHNKYYKTEVDYFSKYQVQLYNKYYIFNNLTYADKLKQQAIYLESRIISKFDVSYCKKISLGMDMLDLNIEKRREKADYAADLFLQNNHNIKIHEPLYGSVFWRLNLFILDTRNKILEEILHQSLPIGSWFPPVDLFFEGKRSVDDIMPVSDKIGDQILNVLVNDQVDRSYYDKLNTIFIQNEE